MLWVIWCSICAEWKITCNQFSEQPLKKRIAIVGIIKNHSLAQIWILAINLLKNYAIMNIMKLNTTNYVLYIQWYFNPNYIRYQKYFLTYLYYNIWLYIKLWNKMTLYKNYISLYYIWNRFDFDLLTKEKIAYGLENCNWEWYCKLNRSWMNV